MKLILIFLVLSLSVMSCKKSETDKQVTENTTTETIVKTDVGTTEIAVQPKAIELTNDEAEAFALEFDDLLKEIEEADRQNNAKAMPGLKTRLRNMDAKTAEIGKKVDAAELSTYEGFTGKRKDAAESILSKY